MRFAHVKFAMLWGLGLALVLVVSSTPLPAAEAAKESLNAEWEFRALNADQHPEVAAWHAAQVPGVVQTISWPITSSPIRFMATTNRVCNGSA